MRLAVLELETEPEMRTPFSCGMIPAMSHELSLVHDSRGIMITYMITMITMITILIGGIPTPLKNMKVRLDHHPNYWGK